MNPRIPLLATAAALTFSLAACSTPAPLADSGTELSEPAPPPDLASTEDAFAARLDGVIDGTWRSAEHRARDPYRNPRETLGFFGVAPDQTLIEIIPGAGWYSEILAPLLREDGHYIGALVDPTTHASAEGRQRGERGFAQLRGKFAGDPAIYGQPELRSFDPRAPVLGAPGSVDVVLTFRNVHNWRYAGTHEAMFAGFFDVLRPGGTLGVVEHRAGRDVPEDDRSGYLGQDQVIAWAEAAGFRLVEASEINANPRDTRDHPNGVWTLPPTLNVPDGEDPATYEAIGESDRMTLRFVKPAG